MPARAIVVDDEMLARRRIVRLLGERNDVQVVAECGGGLEALAAIGRLQPDLLFLDIQMPEIDGFEVLRRLDARRPPAVVFVTAYDRYAVRAFDACAQDYLLKPFDEHRFTQAVNRALEHLAAGDVREREARLHSVIAELRRLGHAVEQPGESESVGDAEASQRLDRFLVRDEERSTVIRAEEVDWIESDGNYVWLHVGKISHLLRATLASCADRLDKRHFVRIHRRYIVNVQRVKEIEPRDGGGAIVILADGHRLRLSRNFREEFQRRIRAGT